MAQVSYGTITITDTNDISRIYVEYCRSTSNQLSGTTVPNITRAWGETTPPWVDGEYIWQRAVVEKSGTLEKTYGTPVCISGEKGETGQQGPQGGTGAAGRSLDSTETKYAQVAANSTEAQVKALTESRWTLNVPSYNSSLPEYWVRVTNIYSNPTKTQKIYYKDNGITDAVKTSAEANATASAANTTAGEAKTQAAAADGKADTAIGTANTANTNATNALNIATGINQHFWTIATDYATGIPAGSYITDTAIDTFKSNKTGGNLLTRSDGIWIRNGVNTLTSLTGTALTFYNPTDNKAQLVIGANGTLQSGNYVRGTDLKFSDSGTKIDLTYGDIITKYFRLSQGVESGINAGAYIYGTIEAIDGKIGSNTTNYWEIGNYTDYLLQPSAKLIGHGSSFIQLGNSGTWRLATNRIHTGWYESGDSYLHFPIFTNGTTNKRWDYGIHVPTSKDDKFLYIRNASSTTDLSNLISDLEDTQNPKVWEYQFYIDGSGNVHAPGFYIGNSTTPIGGGAGTTAQKIINSDNTYGKGSSTKPIYIDTSGYVQESNSNVGNSTTPIYMSGGTLTALGYTIAKSVPSNAIFTDENVNTSQANTTKIYLTGTSTAGSSTGKLNFDSNVYLTTEAGTLHATKFEGTATQATSDSDGNKISTTYLKLTGGNVTGAVTFGSSVSADELTVGDLVVNGSASFTNNLQANTINGVAVGSNPKFTDTVTTVTVTGNGNAITSASASNGAVTLTKGTTFPTGSGTNGYLTKWTGANTIGNGPALGSDTTKFLNNKGEWAVPAGTGLTSVGASGSGGITISGSPITTSGTIAIGLDLSTAINGLGEGASPATREDYIVAQYAGGGTTTTSYHRRKLSNIFAALNSSDITTALGYTPPTTDTNTHRPIQLDSIEILGNNTTAFNLVTGGGMALSNSSGAVTIAHKDTSSQSSSSNSGRTYIQSITLDGYGHVTGLATATETVSNTHYITHLYVGKSNSTGNATTTATDDTYLRLFDDTTARESHKLSGSNGLTITSDANGHITFNSPSAFTAVEAVNTGTTASPKYVLRFTKSGGGTTDVSTENIAVIQSEGANKLVTAGTTTGIDVTGPVKFSGGVPVQMTAANGDSISWSLITGAPSTYTPSAHTHGNLSNDGKITSTVTIASGDRLVIVDTDSTAGSKITGSSITFGTSETTFLTNKGTWVAPVGTTYTFDGTYNASTNKAATVSTVTNAINNLDVTAITGNAGQTITSISETNGKISATYSNISITKSQISDFPTSMTPAAHNHSQIVTVGDQRSTATTPNSYSNALIFQGLKSKATVGSPSDDTYSYLVGLRGWSDSSGGNSHELAFNNTGIFWRQGATTSWGNWYRIYTTGNKPTASDVGLGNVTNYDSSVAIKSITRSGTTFTYTTVAGNTGTFTQQDNNTWDALSTSQAGYVAKAPNDTSKFLRGDATWAAVTKANVGLGNVENTALSTWTGTNKITTLGTITSGTWNGSAIPIANGGTGQTTAANAIDALLNGLPVWTADPTDSTYFVRQDTGGTASYGKVAFSTIWNYISGKINNSGKYVTIDTDQTITASQKTFTGATRWGSASKYGAVHYDSTLEALVFSFA